jgi:hypothetical protein
MPGPNSPARDQAALPSVQELAPPLTLQRVLYQACMMRCSRIDSFC